MSEKWCFLKFRDVRVKFVNIFTNTTKIFVSQVVEMFHTV